MAYNTKDILVDLHGKPIPQYFDVATDSFKPMSNSVSASIVGSYANQFEQLTIDATAGGISLTAGAYSASTKAFIVVEGADIRFRVDGGAPTATLGLLVKDGGIIKLDSLSDIQHFKAIRTSTTSATINCSYSA